MKRTWARFEAVMKQGSEGGVAALPPGNPDGEKKEVRERLKDALNCAVVNPKVKSIIKQEIPPRACGENGRAQETSDNLQRSPLRMRRKDNLDFSAKQHRRITPACAGKTIHSIFPSPCRRHHPRACEENIDRDTDEELREGSPPRVRGKRVCLI